MDSGSDLWPSHYMSHTTCRRLKPGRNEAHCRSPSLRCIYEGEIINWINERLDVPANHKNADNATIYFKFGGSENQLVWPRSRIRHLSIIIASWQVTLITLTSVITTATHTLIKAFGASFYVLFNNCLFLPLPF